MTERTEGRVYVTNDELALIHAALDCLAGQNEAWAQNPAVHAEDRAVAQATANEARLLSDRLDSRQGSGS